MEKIDLIAKARSTKGKNVANRLRVKLEIPAVLYGNKKEPEMLTVVIKDLNKLLHSKAGSNVLINLKIEGKEDVISMMKELQVHPVSGNLLHVDLYAVNMSKPIEVKAPVKMKGEAPGVKLGGTLEFHLREIAIKCLPDKLPDFIEVDVSGLGMGASLHVSDLKVNEGVLITEDPKETVCLVSVPKVEEVAAVDETAPTGPEVIGEKEKEEKRAAEEAAKGGKPAPAKTDAKAPEAKAAAAPAAKK